jgi:hypothetical protein
VGPIPLTWMKCQGEVWCNLSTVNLGHAAFDNMVGVYVVWHAGPAPATVYVGRGNVREGLTARRIDPHVQAFAPLGLYVTWAPVHEAFIEGIRVYLTHRLSPKVVEPLPPVSPIEAKLPW